MSTYSYKLIETESVSAVTATPSVALGTRRLKNGNEYIYGYNGTNTAAAVGMGVMASANSGFTFAVTTVSGCSLMGVVQNATIGNGYYGWLLTRGLARSITNVSGMTQAMPIVLGDGGAFETASATTMGPGELSICGVAIDDAASAGTCAAWIRGVI